MKILVSYEPKGFVTMSNKRVLIYVLGGALGFLLIVGAMFYHHHRIDPIALIIGIAVFATISICGYIMKLNTRFCWNNDIFTVLNFTGNPEKEFNWDDLEGVYTNDFSSLMSLVFNANGKRKEIELNMKDDGIDDLLSFVQSRNVDSR